MDELRCNPRMGTFKNSGEKGEGLSTPARAIILASKESGRGIRDLRPKFCLQHQANPPADIQVALMLISQELSSIPRPKFCGDGAEECPEIFGDSGHRSRAGFLPSAL